MRGEIPPEVYNLLEKAGYTHTPAQSAKLLADDKKAMYEFFAKNGFCCPKTLCGSRTTFRYEYLCSELGTPFIAKPRFGSLGRGIVLVDFEKVLQSLPDGDWIFQTFIDTACGTDNPRDIRIFAAGGRVLAAVERTGVKGGIVSNVHQGGECAKKEVPESVTKTALSVIEKAGLWYGTADFLYDGSTYWLCEINASPGFEGVEKLGFNIAGAIIQNCLLLLNTFNNSNAG